MQWSRGGLGPRSLLAAGIVLALMAGVAGCAQQGSSSKSNRHFTVGLAEISTTIPFLAVMDKAFTTQATKLGMSTVVLDAKLSDSTQASNIATLVAQKVDLIVVVSSSARSVVTAINKAQASGIPVIALNAAPGPGAKVVTYVGDSDYDYGAGEGKLLVEALPNGGRIAVILGPKGDTPTSQRLAGLVSVISHHNFHIVATPTDDFDAAKNLSVTQDLLVRFHDGQLDAIVAEGPQMYAGANYARKYGRSDVKFIAGDFPKEVRSAIKSGALFGTVNQSPSLEGKMAAKYAHEWLIGNRGAVPQPRALIDLPLITATNVASAQASWSLH
ncbi:MAG: ribose transport system substrate-binding protein [Actinomycetota bacterium]|nr:ribose transport system substrate-binding protein [Actinomycetota bacterium]